MQVATSLGEPSSAALDLVDIVSLASLRSEDAKLQDVVANRVHTDESGKYIIHVWLRSHEIIDWKEETWVARLILLPERDSNANIKGKFPRDASWKVIWILTIAIVTL